jgi:aspartyl protease
MAFLSETLTFEKTHYYNTLKPGISLTAILHHGQESVECEARLDTGSSHCIFKRSHGELLGLDIESTVAEKISTVTGSFQAHPHTITIEVLGIRSEAMVYFAADDQFTRSVLGRIGWLDRVKLGLIDYEAKLLLGRYR